jgi:hypothetical protein
MVKKNLEGQSLQEAAARKRRRREYEQALRRRKSSPLAGKHSSARSQ